MVEALTSYEKNDITLLANAIANEMANIKVESKIVCNKEKGHIGYQFMKCHIKNEKEKLGQWQVDT